MTDQPNTPIKTQTLGVVLAGGLSRRMGGRDKGLLALRGRPMLDRVIDRFSPQVDLLILNSNNVEDNFSTYNLPLVRDSVPGHQGPLAGILTAMEAAEPLEQEVEWIASTPADSPFIPADMVARLLVAAQAEGRKIACAKSGDRSHPVMGVWHMSLLEHLRWSLAETEQRSLMGWIKQHGMAEVTWPVGEIDPFFNVNTPEDMKQADILYDLVK